MDPSPDYDASDEIEFFIKYSPGASAGSRTEHGYPPPAYPPVYRRSGLRGP